MPGLGYLGDDLGDVLQRLFDGVLGHVPLKSGDISNQVNCRGENKPSAAVYFHLHSPSIHIERTSNTTIYNVFAPFFPLRRLRRTTAVTSVGEQVLLDFVPAVLQNVGHVLSNLLHNADTQARTAGTETRKDFCFVCLLLFIRNQIAVISGWNCLPFHKGVQFGQFV